MAGASTLNAPGDPRRPSGGYRRFGLLAGPSVAMILIALPAPHGLTAAGWMAAAVVLWMAIWWMTEAIPLAVTALLPLVAFPLLGVSDLKHAAGPFSNPVIFLFLGGFWMALAMQRWQLHRRIALQIVSRVGRRPRALVAGVMVATAILSMWVSNTATAMMMMPIALSLIKTARQNSTTPDIRNPDPLPAAMMLGVAYAASIGGLGTLVGSPPNALVAGFLSQAYGIELGFARWILFGIPIVLLLLPLSWLVLTRIAFRVPADGMATDADGVDSGLRMMKLMGTPEKRLSIIIALVAVLWIVNPIIASKIGAQLLSDSGIAVAGATLLFVIPAGRSNGERLLNWAWARKAPWDILLLFGGGLSLAQAVDGTGLAAWLGSHLEVIAGWRPVLLILAVVTLVVFLTELTSNTATAAAFLPIVGALAVVAQIDPLLLTVSTALALSCAFMLPVATPPNAIVFGVGHVTLQQMMRAGWWLNLTAIGVITAVVTIWRWLDSGP